MKNVQAFRNWAFVDFVGNAVRSALAVANPNQTVIKAVFLAMPSPFPTARFRYFVFGKKALLDGVGTAVLSLVVGKIAVSGRLHIMASAKATTDSLLIAMMALHEAFSLFSKVEESSHKVNKRSMCHAL